MRLIRSIGFAYFHEQGWARQSFALARIRDSCAYLMGFLEQIQEIKNYAPRSIDFNSVNTDCYSKKDTKAKVALVAACTLAVRRCLGICLIL